MYILTIEKSVCCILLIGSSLFSVGAGMQREARTGLPEISRGRKPPDFHRLRRRPGGAAEITGADNRDAILGAENQRE
jgi:hypothetical protein